MDLRRILNVAYAHLTRELPSAKRQELDADLAAKFDYEMTPAERRTAEYRRKAAEMGIDLSAQNQLMDAFKMPAAKAARA